VESVKAASDIYSPLSGKIVKVNERLNDEPQLLNSDPYGEGWLVKIQPSNLDEDLGNLMKGDTVGPWLKAEVELAHRHGARFGYICSSGTLPMIDVIIEAGVDVLIGVDPIQDPHADLLELKRKAEGRLCLWGGVSGAVTVEMGTEQEVREAVRRAIQALGPSGFILSPVDNLTVGAPRTWRNVEVLIDEWRRQRTPT